LKAHLECIFGNFCFYIRLLAHLDSKAKGAANLNWAHC